MGGVTREAVMGHWGTVVNVKTEPVFLVPTTEIGVNCIHPIPLVQGKEHWLCFAGAAVKRYSTPKVRETQVRR